MDLRLYTWNYRLWTIDYRLRKIYYRLRTIDYGHRTINLLLFLRAERDPLQILLGAYLNLRGSTVL